MRGFVALKRWERGMKQGFGKHRNASEDSKTNSGPEVSLVDLVKFWKDRWCRELSLRDSFLVLYSIASSRDAWVLKCLGCGS